MAEDTYNKKNRALDRKSKSKDSRPTQTLIYNIHFTKYVSLSVKINIENSQFLIR